MKRILCSLLSLVAILPFGSVLADAPKENARGKGYWTTSCSAPRGCELMENRVNA